MQGVGAIDVIISRLEGVAARLEAAEVRAGSGAALIILEACTILTNKIAPMLQAGVTSRARQYVLLYILVRVVQ